jgi:hypothetical protein
MKKYTLIMIIGLITFSFQQGISQTFLGPRVGGFIGTTSSDIVGEIVPIDWKVGTEFGITAEKFIHKNWSLVSGIQYSNRGFSISQGTEFSVFGINLPVSARADFNLHYIESPLMVKYTLPMGRTNIYGIAGGALSYASSASIETKADLILDINLGRVDINFAENNMARWNTSAIIGAGVEHPLENGKLFLDIKYNHGLNDLLGTSIIDLNVRNKGFSLGLGYAMTF